MKIVRGNDKVIEINTNMTDYTASISGYKFVREITVKDNKVVIPYDLRCGDYRLCLSGHDKNNEQVYSYIQFKIVESDDKADEILLEQHEQVYIPYVSY